MRSYGSQMKKCQSREIENEQFEETLNIEIERIKAFITNKWQSQWEAEEYGRENIYIQDVTFSECTRGWFKLNRFSTYLITGYGPIHSTLHRKVLVETNICPMCRKKKQTTEHVIFDCIAFQRVRFADLETYRNNKGELISDEQMLDKFDKLAKNVFEIRKEGVQNENRGSASANGRDEQCLNMI